MTDSALLEYFNSHLNYNPDTGQFTWIKNKRSHLVGKTAGVIHKRIKYVNISFRIAGKFKSYLAHRLAWFMTYGVWPKNEVDHLNGIKHDNRIYNLKDKTKRENLSNQYKHRAGHLVGTCFLEHAQKWMAQITINKKHIYLGLFNTELEAHEVYKNKLSEIIHKPKGEYVITLTIKGNNYKEIKKQIFELANDIATDSDDDIEIQPQATREFTLTHPAPATVPSFIPPAVPTTPLVATQPMNEVPAPARKRRSKAEIEADKAAKLQAAQAEVVAAQASHATTPPITIPQVPTTNHVVNIPTEVPSAAPTPVVVQQAPPPPAIQAPAGAYTLETFKQNLVMILNSLLSTGKLNSAWIADTSKAVFGGADIWLWSQNQEKIQELFNMFVEWGFIQEFKG